MTEIDLSDARAALARTLAAGTSPMVLSAAMHATIPASPSAIKRVAPAIAQC